MTVMSSIFVIPIFHTSTHFYACILPWGVSWLDYFGNANHAIRLEVQPEISCMEGGHLFLIICLVILMPMYVWALIPYATCQGDFRYVIPGSVLHGPTGLCGTVIPYARGTPAIETFKAQAKRKASTVHKLKWQLTPGNVFVTFAYVLVPTVLFPFLVHFSPRGWTVGFMLLIALGQWVVSLIYAPYLERKSSVLSQDAYLWSVCTMFCTVVTVMIDDKTSWKSFFIWIFLTLCVLVWAILRYIALPAREVLVRTFKPGQGGS